MILDTALRSRTCLPGLILSLTTRSLGNRTTQICRFTGPDALATNSKDATRTRGLASRRDLHGAFRMHRRAPVARANVMAVLLSMNEVSEGRREDCEVKGERQLMSELLAELFRHSGF